MTNHIEQMMKAAGVECSTKCAPIGANCKNGCDNCERLQVFYPPFTPAKQLEFIKLIGTYGNICITKQNYNNNWCITNHFKNGIGQSTNFGEALAIFITNIIDKLDKAEVKRILEE